MVDNNIFVFGENIILIMKIVSCNDDIFTGGFDGKSAVKDILQYKTASHTWEEVGQMEEARVYHAVGVLEDVSQLCP